MSSPLFALGYDAFVLLWFSSVCFAACWLVAKKLDNWSIVDVLWSFGFAGVALRMLYLHWFGLPMGGQGVLMAVATTLWSLRLGTHLAIRVLGHLDREDGRYLKMRAEHGEGMAAQMAYFYFVQAAALTLLCLPLLSSSPAGATGPTRPIHWVGLGVAALAVLIEAVADAQLASFKKDPANKGQVCERGLWAWSRHPNYFGEWLVWVGFLLMSYNAEFRGLPGLFCVVLMYYFLNRVTGIPLTEQQLLTSKGPAYADYQARVPAFWPRPPRR